ncbi:hypothetical protein CSV72_13715 [Sporosarcina sp. P20a]|uniref:hypothetical protein n=1 Tax=Sporosarcina sp. P20a TaxID=2048256 RepID=UPI000C16894D|nr:hypothetical protein [Sporosarcina sp. P20a]PIC85382.1 hypothetical protein CSV72_13715 [Sporosarcina sp. P20a]
MASQKNSKWSLVLSMVGVIAFRISYLISENPTLLEKVVIGTFFFSGIALMIGGIILGIRAFKMEKGKLKYLGFAVIILFMISLALPLLLMALFGFGG